MNDANFHDPNGVELEFLRFVTLGYPELRLQVESCQISDYDATGYCDLRVIAGPPLLSSAMCSGPSIKDEQGFISVILWVRNRGYLDCVEFVAYIGQAVDVFGRFVKAGRSSKLRYEFDPDFPSG